MKDQVTSIEQSRRLLELGVPVGKASMMYQSHYTQGVPKLYAQPYQRNGYPAKEKIREDVIPAFTVADLLNLLPMYVITEWGSEPLKVCKVQSDEWLVGYGYTSPHRSFSRSLVDACVSRIEWLLSDGYKLEL